MWLQYIIKCAANLTPISTFLCVCIYWREKGGGVGYYNFLKATRFRWHVFLWLTHRFHFVCFLLHLEIVSPHPFDHRVHLFFCVMAIDLHFIRLFLWWGGCTLLQQHGIHFAFSSFSPPHLMKSFRSVNVWTVTMSTLETILKRSHFLWFYFIFFKKKKSFAWRCCRVPPTIRIKGRDRFFCFLKGGDCPLVVCPTNRTQSVFMFILTP